MDGLIWAEAYRKAQSRVSVLQPQVDVFYLTDYRIATQIVIKRF